MFFGGWSRRLVWWLLPWRWRRRMQVVVVLVIATVGLTPEWRDATVAGLRHMTGHPPTTIEFKTTPTTW